MRLLNKDTSPHHLPSVELEGRRFPAITLPSKVPSQDISDAHLEALSEHPTLSVYFRSGRIVDADRDAELERARRNAPAAQHAKDMAARDARIRDLEAQLAAAKATDAEKPTDGSAKKKS